MAEALYRKYRPQIFEDVVGQEHIERTIKNAIEQDKVSHAYLFTGPRGTGKTTTARLLAKALLCEHGPTPEPDGTCSNCLAIANGTHPDVYELDAASRTGVENVREEIIGRVQFAPTLGRYKVYIIDEVHMLSTAAFNALLKTLEEPPSHVVFILCTTDPQKVPETIHSRCQRFDFRRISTEAIVSRLGAICVAEEVDFDGDALELIAHRAEGGMRNALTSLEQIIAFSEGKVTLESAEQLLGSLDSNDMAEIVTAIGKRDIGGCFVWTANYVETGADLAQFVRDLAQHIRNMYVLTLSDSDTVLEVGEVERRELAQEMQYFEVDRLTRMLAILGDLSNELRTSINPRLSFEIALTRMVRPDSDLTLEALAERVEALEAGHSATAHVFSSPSPAAQQGQPQGQPVKEQAAASAPSAQTQVLQQGEVSSPAGDLPFAEGESGRASVNQAAPQGVAPSVTQEAIAPSTAQETAPSSERAGQSTDSCQASIAGLENPAALQRIWQATLQTVKKDKAAYGVLFLNTRASYDAQKKEMLIEFPAENKFAYSAVQKPEVMATLSAALQQAAGGQVAFRFTQATQATTSQQSTPSAQMPRQEPVVSAASAVPAEPVEQTSRSQQPDRMQQSVPGLDDEQTPLDAYDDYMPAYRGEANIETPVATTADVPVVQEAASEPAADGVSAMSGKEGASADVAESELKSLLTETYGEGIVFEMIEEEQ